MENLRITKKPLKTTSDFIISKDWQDWDICVRSFGGTETRFKKDGKRSSRHFGRCYKKGHPIEGFLPNITADYIPCVLIKCIRPVDEVFEILDQVDFIADCDYLSTPSLSGWEVIAFYEKKKQQINSL